MQFYKRIREALLKMQFRDLSWRKRDRGGGQNGLPKCASEWFVIRYNNIGNHYIDTGI
jgi:hypothetical protein